MTNFEADDIRPSPESVDSALNPTEAVEAAFARVANTGGRADTYIIRQHGIDNLRLYIAGEPGFDLLLRRPSKPRPSLEATNSIKRVEKLSEAEYDGRTFVTKTDDRTKLFEWIEVKYLAVDELQTREIVNQIVDGILMPWAEFNLKKSSF
jgi:hypothetical protein